MTAEGLEALFPSDEHGNTSSFEYDTGIQRFVGHVICRDFRGVSISQRQKQVFATIEEQFAEEAQLVSLVLTFTPEEWDEVNEEAASA